MSDAAKKRELAVALEQKAKIMRTNRLRYFKPYPKQKLFMALGATHRERMLSAGTQCGKSEGGAVEMSYHLTGLYPDWWEGRRFDQPVTAWTAGESAQSVRIIQQTKLLGTPGVAEALGTGFLPKATILKTSPSHGVADSIDSVLVRHATGGISSLTFLSYEKKREKFQGASCHVIWLDEECPMDIYSECMGRVTATKGIVYATETPLMGMTDLCIRFFQEPSPDRALVQMDIEEAEHIPASEREKIIAGYLPHEREARTRGIPTMGAGRIFQTPETDITIEPFEIPPHFFLIWGCDFGTRHPAAFVLLAWDKDADIVYIARTLRMSDALFKDHALAVIRSLGGTWAKDIPVAWPSDGQNRREFGGELTPVAEIYRHHGLKMLSKWATEKDGSISFEAGLQRLVERFATNRLKVFNTCAELFEEYRNYHSDTDGKVVKERDDVLSALRQGVTMLRSARNDILFDPTSPTGRAGNRSTSGFVKGDGWRNS